MGILLFIVSFLTALYLFFAFLGAKRVNFLVILMAALLIGFLTKTFGTYSGCADGWISENIGEQGACSHHGGVVTYFNTFGAVAMSVCVFMFVIVIAIQFIKFRNDL